MAGSVRIGLVRRGTVRQGDVRQARCSLVGNGADGGAKLGFAGSDRLSMVMLGMVWPGSARLGRQGLARFG